MLQIMIRSSSDTLLYPCRALLNSLAYTHRTVSVYSYQLCRNSFTSHARSNITMKHHTMHGTWKPLSIIPSLQGQVSVRCMQSDSNQEERSWSNIGKMLLIMWSATFVVIALVLAADWNINSENRMDTADRKRKIERVQGSEGMLPYLYSIPCIRNSFLLAFVGAVTSWVVTFLLTSNPSKAYKVAALTPAVVFGLFFTYCNAASSQDRADAAELAKTLKDIQQRRARGSTEKADEDK